MSRSPQLKIYSTQHRSLAMHLYLWASLAGSCLLRPGLSLLGGRESEGRRYGSSHRHQASAARSGRRRPASTATVTTAFAAAAAAAAAAPAFELDGRSICGSSSGAAWRSQHLAAQPMPRQQIMHLQQRQARQRRRSVPTAAHACPLLQRPAAPPSSWRLCAARADPDDEDYYSDRGRTAPPPLARRSGRAAPVRRAGRGGGRPGSGAGRGVAEGGRGARDAPPPAGGGGASGGRGRGRGIDQNDPLVRDWKSAKVLAAKHDRGPTGAAAAAAGRGERRYVQDSAGRGGGGGGRGRGGRGRGRGGRGRGRGHNKTPVNMYVGSDTVPWYIKEVQDKGLDTQGEFSQWWQRNLDPEANVAAVKGMKVDELKAQLGRMGLPTSGLKAALAERLTAAYRRYSLADDNFQHAEVVDVSADDDELPNCFPQVYEKLTEDELEKLRRETSRRKKKKKKSP